MLANGTRMICLQNLRYPGKMRLMLLSVNAEESHSEVLKGKTSLLIAPGYQFRYPDILITNFHQPRSTLLLLIAAFIGEDWRKAYQYALDHDFRFLSYGDGCLFFREG